MASVWSRKNGCRSIQYAGINNKRETINLGSVTLSQANEFKARIERLLDANNLGQSLGRDLTDWLNSLTPDTYKRLVELKLVNGRSANHTVGELIQAYKSSRTVTAGTAKNMERVYLHIKTYFKETKLLSEVTPADGISFRNWLRTNTSERYAKDELAQATVSRRCRLAQEIFAYATTKLKWLSENPLGDLRGWHDTNRERDFYVSPELTSKLIDAATNAEFRAIIALVRGAGLRCPSEVTPLLWDWIDWDNEVIHVRATKTRRYPNGSIREVPLFPLAFTYLRELQEQAENGEPLVFPQHQVSGAAIAHELERCCRTIKISMWDKPWINMRGSCETDLVETAPFHVVAKWIGHSPQIARKHYLKITKEHHTRAVTGDYSPQFATHHQQERDRLQNVRQSTPFTARQNQSDDGFQVKKST